jgi:hypothetical protein
MISEEFQMICANCGSMKIMIEDPVDAPSNSVVICGNCGSARGTIGSLRELATRSTLQTLPTGQLSERLKSGSELVSMHRELQRLRREVQMEESKAQAES